MTKITAPVREFNRLKDVFVKETYPDIDGGLYEIESIHVEKMLTDMSRSTFRKLVEFLVENYDKYGQRIEGKKKNNIIINSRVVSTLILDRRDSIAELHEKIEMLEVFKKAQTNLNQAVVLNLIDRWWLTIPDCIGRTAGQERGWYYYDIDDMISLLQNHIETERRIFQQLLEAEISAEDRYKSEQELLIKRNNKKKKREAKLLLKQQRKEARQRRKEKREQYGLA